MKSSEEQIGCQIEGLDRIPDPNAEVLQPPLARRMSLKVARRLNPRIKWTILERVDHLVTWFSTRTGRSVKPAAFAPRATATVLKTGDLVRVRSKEEVEATLNIWRQLKGCGFMEEMEPYCGTTQWVLKPVKRFLDERDYTIKKCQGIVLLEGLMCQGTEAFGPCDRSCYYFWREEWLEKID